MSATKTKKAPAKKKATAKKATKKKVVAKKSVKKKATKRATKKRVVTGASARHTSMLDPQLPDVPHMPTPPKPNEPGVCKHCHMLPAAGVELVIVLVALVFSLTAVLLTSVEALDQQQTVIETLQTTKGYYVSR